MPKYKVLGSVAHNLGHSFLSDMNGVPGRGVRWVIVPERIYEIARDRGLDRVEIDFLSGSIEPKDFATREVQKAVGGYRKSLPDIVNRQGAHPSMVRAVTLELQFDLGTVVHDPREPGRHLPSFECRVEILDDRGKVHSGVPRNWWVTFGGPLEEWHASR